MRCTYLITWKNDSCDRCVDECYREMCPKLNVARILPQSRVNGPGERTVIWFQGCATNCKGCFNPEFQPFTIKTLYTARELFDEIKRNDVEGITLSGGEPLEQNLHEMVRFLRLVQRHGLSVLLFTGREVVHVDVYHLADVIVFGPYVESKRTRDLPLRGSYNQQLCFCSNRYSEDDMRPQGYEVHVQRDEIFVTGFPPDDYLVFD